jgi:hypothetical protein
MNDFDVTLELKLRYLLDPVVASTPPPRRGSKKVVRPALAIVPATTEPTADSIPARDPLVMLPVALHVL